MPSYSYDSISFPGAADTYAYAINDSGEVVGGYALGGADSGFTELNGTSISVNDPGSSTTSLQGVNASGQISGTYTSNGGSPSYFGFHASRSKNSNWPTLDDPSAANQTSGYGLNDSRQVVGNYYSGG